MNNFIHAVARPTAFFLIAGAIFFGCNEAPTAFEPGEPNELAQEAAVTDAVGVASKHITPVAEWHVASSFTCSLNPANCPNIAQAANGETIEIRQDDGAGATFAGGTLSVHHQSASGSGTFVHKGADGSVLGTGSWTATELLSFKDWGQSPVFCAPDFPIPALCAAHAGRALIRVHLVADSGPEFEGILRVTCLLPGIKVPGSYAEGATLSIMGGPNFNKLVVGITVFVA